MTYSDEGVYILTSLGLTISEAKIYLALSKTGPSTAKTISQVSNIAREHVYRIIPKLKKLGLVEEVIDLPTRYNPIHVKDAMAILFNRRIDKTTELQEKADNFLGRTLFDVKTDTSGKCERQFVLIPEKGAFLRRIKNTHEAAKQTIDIVTTKKRFPMAMFTFADSLQKALNKDVSVRIITETIERREMFDKSIENLNTYSSFRVRFTPCFPSVVMLIYDKKEAIVVTSASSDLLDSPALWTNNPSILAVFIDFFEMLWSESHDYSLPNTADDSFFETKQL